MNTYKIPRGDLPLQAYYEYVHSLPWNWVGIPSFLIDPSDQLVTVDATITGFESVILPPTPIITQPISKLTFLDKFTDAELAAILTAAKTVVQVEVFVKKLDAASEVNLGDSRTIAGVQALEQFGLIGTGRASQILGI